MYMYMLNWFQEKNMEMVPSAGIQNVLGISI